MDRRTFLKLTGAVTFLPTTILPVVRKKKSIAECILEMAKDCNFKISPANLAQIVLDTDYYEWLDNPTNHRLLFCKPRHSSGYLFNISERTWKRDGS